MQLTKNNSMPADKSTLVPGGSALGSAAWQQLGEIFCAMHPVAYTVNFAKITHDPKACLFLSQLVYWTRHGTKVLANHGWIFKTREQWLHETGLSRHEQQSARARLLALGLIEEARVGSPARNSYRVVSVVLGSQLAQCASVPPVQWSLLDIRANTEQTRFLLGHKLAFYRAFVDITGSAACAIYLSKALSIQRRIEEKGHYAGTLSWDRQWFCMKTSQILDDTGLTQAQQREARAKLVKIGLMHEALMTHPRRQTYVRMDLDGLCQKLAAHLPDMKAVKPICATSSVLVRRTKTEEVAQIQNNVADLCASGAEDLAELPPAVRAGGTITPEILMQDPICATLSLCHKTLPNDKVAQLPTTDAFWAPDTSKVPPKKSPLCGNRPSRRTVFTRQTAAFCTSRWSLLAHLHARAGCLTTSPNTTTTTKSAACQNRPTASPPPPVRQTAPLVSDTVVVASSQISLENLVLPGGLTLGQQSQCRHLVSPLAAGDQQEILFELMGLMDLGGVRSPVSYLRRLVHLHRATPGGLLLEKAEEARARSQARAQIAALQTKASAMPASVPGTHGQTDSGGRKPATTPSAVALAARQKLRDLAQRFKRGEGRAGEARC